MNKNEKEEIIEFLNHRYDYIDLNKIAKERTGDTNAFSIELAKYAIEADKLNIFLVATNARKRAPVYIPVSNNIKRALGIRPIKTNADLKETTGFCSQVITKKPYTFNLNKEEKLLFKLAHLNQTRYTLEESKYNTHEFVFLEASNYIKTTVKGDKTLFSITKNGQSRIDKILGKLFDYPKCCVNAFIQRNVRFSLTSGKINKFTLEAVPEHIKCGLNEDFLPYNRCSSNCKKSLNMIKSIKEYLNLLGNNPAK